MIYILALMLCVGNAWGLGSEPNEILFVRPVSQCGVTGCGAGNGSTYGDAYGGYADVCDTATPGTANCVDANDTLISCGSFGAADVDTAGVMRVINRDTVTNDGDCSAYGGPSEATLDGETSVARGFDSGSGGSLQQTIRNFHLTRFNLYGVISQNSNLVTRSWVIGPMRISNLRAPSLGTASAGLFLRGAGNTVTSVRIENVGDECIYSEGDNLTVSGSGGCSNWGLDNLSPSGDGLQISGDSDATPTATGIVITGQTWNATIDAKQCVIIQAVSGNIGADIYGNRCTGPSESASLIAAYFLDGSGTVNLYRNIGNKVNYFAYAVNGVTLNAWSNLGYQLNSYGIQLGSTGTNNANLFFNVMHDADRCIDTDTATAGTAVIQNNAAINCGVAGILRNTGDTESFNATFGSVTPCVLNGSGTSCGTGNVAANPRFVGIGTGAEDFRTRSASPLRRAGTFVGAYHDFGNRLFSTPPSIGAWEAASGDQANDRSAR